MTTLHEAVAHLDPFDKQAVIFGAHVVNDGDYHTWVQTGITLFILTEGSEFGLDFFQAWSAQHPKNLPTKNEQFWSDPWWRASHLSNLMMNQQRQRRPLDSFDHTTATAH